MFSTCLLDLLSSRRIYVYIYIEEYNKNLSKSGVIRREYVYPGASYRFMRKNQERSSRSGCTDQAGGATIQSLLLPRDITKGQVAFRRAQRGAVAGEKASHKSLTVSFLPLRPAPPQQRARATPCWAQRKRLCAFSTSYLLHCFFVHRHV